MHALLEEICRTPGVGAVQPHCFNRWQRELRYVISPLLDEREALQAQVADLQAKLDAVQAAVPVKRPRGRPRKHPRAAEVTA